MKRKVSTGAMIVSVVTSTLIIFGCSKSPEERFEESFEERKIELEKKAKNIEAESKTLFEKQFQEPIDDRKIQNPE